MPQSQVIDPAVVRQSGAIVIEDIPVNSYRSCPTLEIKKYGKETLSRVLYDMLTIREFETMLNDIKLTGSYRGIEYNHRGPAHLSIGQESTAVGMCLNLDIDDFVFGSHRSHGD
ncbi:MAG: dehydrogenase, partial [Spirochaetaceae bacterium]|nr:dehydrogenase [Spirochaetaceae bacterium]